MKNDTNSLIMSQLQMIEHCYGLSMLNKEEICRAISRATRNRREILTVALALNNWVAVHGTPDCITIPEQKVQEIICGVIGRW
ncbi:MAG TPA: hypothetical protein VMS89_01330 [Methanoregulaceae archaeon]|nr:hypothetical protein [Methanoregulaceae archaeon]